MATYNFITGGEVNYDGELHLAVNGPAAFFPGPVSPMFYMQYLGGSELFYYSDGRYKGHVYQIDGVPFEGTLEEFCEAAEALFSTASGGSSYPNITANTSVVLADTKAFNIVDDEGKTLFRLNNDTSNFTQLGDSDTTTGW